MSALHPPGGRDGGRVQLQPPAACWEFVAFAAPAALGADWPVRAGEVLRDAIGRAAAAVVLFDCTAIIARTASGYELWVAASYLHSFSSAVAALRLRA